MNKELFEKVKGYRTTAALYREMVTNQVITEEDYAIVCRAAERRYGKRNEHIFRFLPNEW